MTPLDNIVAGLRAADCDPVNTGHNAYESKCPVHRGSRRNLSIAVGDKGSVMLHCHHLDRNGHGCTVEAIVQSLGLRMEDLWPTKNGATPTPKSSGKRSWKTIEDALRAAVSRIEPKPTLSDHWTYRHADGKPVMVVGRFDGADGKTYRPAHALPDGSWAVGDPPGLLPLYRLPELARHNGTIFVAEGEKCVLALEGIRAVATTSAHGAKSTDKSDWTPLAGKPVVILPDHDEAGEGYAVDVLRILKRLESRPPWVKVVRLPDLADGEDVADWIPRVVGDRAGDEARQAVQDGLQGLVDAAPPIDLDAVPDAPGETPSPAAGTIEAEAPIPIPEWPDPPGDAALHGLAGEVVRPIGLCTEADPIGLLLSFVVGFGNAVGPGLSVLADGHYHHANEYAVTVGDTSRARKGTAWRRVRPVLAHADSSWADDRITGGLSSGEGLIWEVRDPIVGTDKKTDQPVVTDPGVRDKRVLVVEQEFGNVLRVLAREGNTLSAVLRLGWDGDNLRTMTKNSPARATGPHVSLVGHVTAEELARYLSHVEVFNGLGNRILWGCVRRSKSLPFGGSIDDREIARLGNRVASALHHTRTLGSMDWSSSGRKLWEAEYDALTESRPGLWGAITARAEAHVLRLAMIFAALDRAGEIADTHVLAGIELWRYCDRSAAYLFGGSVGDRDADAILAALRARTGGMTRTEISVGVFNKNRPAGDIARSLGLLLRHGLARCEPVP
jgi:hypothetical protein